MERVGGNILKFNFFSCLYRIIIEKPLLAGAVTEVLKK